MVLRNTEHLPFAFHTDKEPNPWLRVDLQECYPIYAIVVRNRTDGFQELARTVSVEVSADGNKWVLCHRGNIVFGDGRDHPALVVPLGSVVWTRFIRLTLRRETHFHLSSVEAYVQGKYFHVLRIRKQYGFLCPVASEVNAHFPESYEAVAEADEDLSGPLIGLSINQNGEFGNSVIQYTTAIEIAKLLDLKYIRVAEGRMITLPESVDIDGITFLPAESTLPSGGVFLKGYYLYKQFFPVVQQNQQSLSQYDIVNGPVRRLLSKIPLQPGQSKLSNTLAIHIRSGDIFSSWVHPDYVQPPLSFYQLVVRRIAARCSLEDVLLVFEDRRNPVIDALQQWLTAQGYNIRIQSSNVENDIAALAAASHLVFGVGTFGPAVALLAEQCETLHYFSPDGAVAFPALPNFREIVRVVDRASSYIKPGTWANSKEQRDLMIDYPEHNLAAMVDRSS